MKTYIAKKEVSLDRAILLEDMLLTKNMPTSAGSKMLEGYESLFEAEAVTRAKGAGYEICGKASVGEFAIDLIGETSYFGAIVEDGVLDNAVTRILAEGGAVGALSLDVNGTPRRAAAQKGMVAIKPTYGTVSRFGTIPVACSGECVAVTAKCADKAREILFAILGHDDKDGTSLSDTDIEKAKVSKPIRRVAVIKNMAKGDEGALASLDNAVKAFQAKGVEVVEIENDIIPLSNKVWNILMCSELCNNISRYDGVRYGHRAESFTNIDELYTRSRTEGFGALTKYALLSGSDNLSTESYMKVYDKAQRVRRLICEAFKGIFGEFDLVLIPAVSTLAYTESLARDTLAPSLEENFYTAPATLAGLPAVALRGVQVIGDILCDATALDGAKIIEEA